MYAARVSARSASRSSPSPTISSLPTPSRLSRRQKSGGATTAGTGRYRRHPRFQTSARTCLVSRQTPVPAERVAIHHLDPGCGELVAERVGCSEVLGGAGFLAEIGRAHV